MPALKETSESAVQAPMDQTLPPGFAKRRVWVAPQITTHSAVILTPIRLYLAPGTTPPPADIVAAVTAGSDPAAVFGPLVTTIHLGAVRSVTHDLLTNTVNIDSDMSGGNTGSWTSRASIAFSEAEQADAMFTKLWRRLGDEFKIRPDHPPLMHMAQLPLTVLLGIFLATAMLALLTNAAADFGASAPGWMQALQTTNWQTIAVCGGMAAAIVQVWLYRRLTRPPVRLELAKGV
jgi:hypothetical protein